jgi:hypothetical protein
MWRADWALESSLELRARLADSRDPAALAAAFDAAALLPAGPLAEELAGRLANAAATDLPLSTVRAVRQRTCPTCARRRETTPARRSSTPR